MDLNLPKRNFKIKKMNGILSIFDRLRNRFVALTPEELVRQHFVSYLIEDLNYPAGLMGNEISLIQNKIKRRCDTLIEDNQGNPLVIIEYKAPNIEITQDVFNQIARYNSVMRAKYLIVSNGLSHFCCKLDYENNSSQFLDHIPNYTEL